MELSEIIKGLRHCVRDGDCADCPAENSCCGTDGMMILAADALEMQRNHVVALSDHKKISEALLKDHGGCALCVHHAIDCDLPPCDTCIRLDPDVDEADDHWVLRRDIYEQS